MIRILILAMALTLPVSVFAQTLHDNYEATWKAQVQEVTESREVAVPGIDATQLYQTLTAKLLNGPQQGDVVVVENDYLELEAGDRFYLNYLRYVDGSEYYTVLNIDRSIPLMLLVGVFVLVVITFGGWQGVRSLLALAGSFAAIFFILLPGLLQGWNPILTSTLVAAGVLFAAIFFTHGFNRGAAVAYAGTMIAVVLTGLIASIAVSATSLSGFASDESVYLNMNTGGTLNFVGLLLGAIIIGVLGVLDDIAVTQVAVVADMYRHDAAAKSKAVFLRAIKIGREHVSALVNTLVLAYAGVSLPLLLYTYLAPVGANAVFNLEVFATEIVRTVVGSIGLILTVPIVTLLAVLFLRGHSDAVSESLGHQH